MRYVISLIAGLTIGLVSSASKGESVRDHLLRKEAVAAGLVEPEKLVHSISTLKSAAGRLLFKSKELSLSREIACQNCHLDKFSSADGIPNGIGTKGHGEGMERALSGGDILPRNTLPFWGRGSIGFNTFFWDGRVDKSSGTVKSQFGDYAPSDDPLAVAAHLPVVEIREMIPDTLEASNLKTETVESARKVYQEIAARIQADRELAPAVSKAFGIPKDQIEYIHIAESLAEFFRDRFRIRETSLHKFVFNGGSLTGQEVAGGLLFYGKGRCALCHNGPFFSDLSFHAIPFGQLGFGKNGFGIDYGRFNVTLDPSDRYKFRTPPLFNVAKTAPYSHSGAVYDLADAIRAHVDPLSTLDVADLTEVQRVEFYKRLRYWAQEPIFEVRLANDEIESLVKFLGTLSFDDPETAHPQ